MAGLWDDGNMLRSPMLTIVDSLDAKRICVFKLLSVLPRQSDL